MSNNNKDTFYCSFVSIHYIICECGETFPSEEALRTHLDRKHPHKRERKEYKCGICEALYSTEEACISHYEESHVDREDMVKEELVEDEEVDDERKEVPLQIIVPVKKKRERKPKSYYMARNIVCEVCGKRYASNAALRYHQRVHTGERPYQCTECPKSFTMPLFLQIHLRTHTGERPYECSQCPKAFSNKAALLRHDRVHTGEKPYECPKCGKFFTQSNSMKLHVNTVHLKMPAPYKSKTRKLKDLEREMVRKNSMVICQKFDECDQEESHEDVQEMVVKEEYVYEDVGDGQVLYEHEMESKEISYEIVYEEE